MEREQAEALLRQQGLNPERCGEAGWELALREAMQPLGATTHSRSQRSGDPSSPPLRRAFAPLTERDREDMTRAMHARLQRIRETTGADPVPEVRAHETDCEQCGGARFVRVTADPHHALFGVPVPCACVGALTDAERIDRAGIPEAYRSMTFESFLANGNSAAAEAVIAWDGRGNVLLLGAPGRGKTHLAVAALRREVMERGRVGRFCYVPAMLDEVRRRYGPDANESAQAYFDGLVAWPTLVLDDLGAERPTAWVVEQIGALIERRLQAGVATLITTNLAGSEAIESVFGARVASRLGGGVYRWVPTGGPDMRQFALPR